MAMPTKRESRALFTTDRQSFTEHGYDLLVEGWNHKRPTERRNYAAECKVYGHDFKRVPWSDDLNRIEVCTRCLTYINHDKESKRGNS